MLDFGAALAEFFLDSGMEVEIDFECFQGLPLVVFPAHCWTGFTLKEKLRKLLFSFF